MSLENGTPSGSPGASDNTNPKFEQPGGAANNSGLDNFSASFWSGKQSLEQPKDQPIVQAPGQMGFILEPAEKEKLSRQLDAGFSTNDLVSAIKDQVKEKDIAHNVSNIKVVYVDKGNDPSQRVSHADFTIGKDGVLNMPENSALLNKKELVIEVDRDQGQLKGPNDAQQKSLKTVLTTLSQTVLERHGKIEDPQGLVSDDLKKQLSPTPEPIEQFPQAMQNAMHDMQRFAGGGRGTLEPNDYMPHRDVARLPNEDDFVAALKNVIAGFATNGEREPYSAVHQLGDRGPGVGRYMFDGNSLQEALDDLCEGCGDPADEKTFEKNLTNKLAKLMHNKGLAAKCAHSIAHGDFKKFIGELKAGKIKAGDPHIAEVLPKELQEVAEGQLIAKYSKGGSVEPTKVAMHLLLGHEPTKEDLSKPEYQQLTQAIERLSNISATSTDNPGSKIDWQDIPGKDGAPSQLMLNIAKRAEHTALKMNSSGYCYQGVADSLRSLGIANLTGNSAYNTAKDQLAMNSHFTKVADGHLTQNNLEQVLRRGDILVHQPSYGHKHGHIAVFLGYDAQGRPMEASDKVRPLIVRPNTAVFQPKDNRFS